MKFSIGVPTNADRIRGLNDEQLAKFLVVPVTFMNGYRADTIFRCHDSIDCISREEAERENLEWLQQPAE